MDQSEPQTAYGWPQAPRMAMPPPQYYAPGPHVIMARPRGPSSSAGLVAAAVLLVVIIAVFTSAQCSETVRSHPWVRAALGIKGKEKVRAVTKAKAKAVPKARATPSPARPTPSPVRTMSHAHTAPPSAPASAAPSRFADLPGIQQGRRVDYNDDALFNSGPEGAAEGEDDYSPLRALAEQAAASVPEGSEFVNGMYITPSGEQIYTHDTVLRAQVENSGVTHRLDSMVVRTKTIHQNTKTPSMDAHCSQMILSARADKAFPHASAMDPFTVNGLYEFCVPMDKQRDGASFSQKATAVQAELDNREGEVNEVVNMNMRARMDGVNGRDSRPDYESVYGTTIEEAGFTADQFGMSA